MHIRPFLLDRWLNEHQFATPPIEFDLAASTGPKWTWRELTSTARTRTPWSGILDTSVYYGPATGSLALREAIAEMADVSPAEVIVVTGASEALWIMLLVAAQPGANVVLPHPAFPTFDEAASSPTAGGPSLPPASRHTSTSSISTRSTRCIDDRTVAASSSTHRTTQPAPSCRMTSWRSCTTWRRTEAHSWSWTRSTTRSTTDRPRRQRRGSSAATTVGDLSKALCLSGLRIGWIIEHDPARIEQYEDARSYLTICGAPVSEVLANGRDPGAGHDPHPGADGDRDQPRRCSTPSSMNTPVELGWVRPTGGMTAFPWLRSGADTRPFCVGAAAAGVLVAPGDCFGLPGSSATRLRRRR